jgi:hypothetical protein
MMAAGMSAAGASVKAFGKSLRAVWAASMGPIAVIIAAVMALSKAFAWVSEVAGRYGKMLRTIQGDNEAEGIRRLTERVKRLTTAYAEANAAADRQAAISKGRTDALRRTVRYGGAADTVPSPDSLQSAGQVLLDEFWDVYKVLLR